MSEGVGTQFTASLNPGQTQTWFTYAWDPNVFVLWSIRPITSPAQVRLDQVEITYDELGITYYLTISNTGQSPATFEGKYYYQTVVQEGDWLNVGPHHMSGCIIQVALDPNDSDRLYALAQGGGLWKLDGISAYPTTTWQPLSDQHESLVGFAFALAPSNSSIIYLAEGSSFLRSDDAGLSWISASAIPLWSSSNPWSHSARRVMIDPENANRVLVASDTGLWQSTNGGGTWSQVLTGDITDAALDPADSSVIYAAQRPVGVLKSTTSGTTWSTVLSWSSVPHPVNTMIKIGLGLNGSAGNRTIAAKFDQQVFVNNQSGTGPWSASSLPPDPWGEQQGDWDNVCAVDPFDNQVILAGTQLLFRSTDGGQTWSTVASYYHPHEDQQSIAVDPNNHGVIYLSNDGGVFRSPDGGQTWMSGSSWSWQDVFDQYDLNFGLVTSLFYRTAVSSIDIGGPVGVGPAHHQGLLGARSLDTSDWDGIQGHAWETANTYSFANQPEVFYLTQGSDLFRQLYPVTGTNDLVNIYPSMGATALAMDNRPGSALLFVGTHSGTLQYTTNPSANPPTWTPALSLGEPIASIAFAPSNPGKAYAITSSGAVYRNDDVSSPGNWVAVASNWSHGGVVQLAVSPTDSTRLYLISGSQIGISTNGGQTWNVVPNFDASTLGTQNFQSIVACPIDQNTVFISGNPGVFRSSDAGSSWSKYDGGLPNASAGWLQWLGDFLYVSTWGRGLWKRAPFGSTDGGDNVGIATQFTGTLSPGATQTWFTWGWPQNWFVTWSVRPTSDGGEVSLDALDVELASTGITYHLTISNTGSQPATFEAKYGYVSF